MDWEGWNVGLKRWWMLAAVALFLAACTPPELTLEPEHVQMLISLDGEEDEYYEELTLLCNGEAVDGRRASWRSSDQKVVTVDRFGWATSRGVGEAQVTAKYRGASASCTIEVKRKITSDTRLGLEEEE